MRKRYITSILIILNALCLAGVWAGYLSYRQSLGMAGPADIPDILLQLALPTALILGTATLVGLLLLYVAAFCIWKLQSADRKTRILTVFSAIIGLAAIGITYAVIYYEANVGPVGLICFLTMFGLAIGVFRYLPQMIAKDRGAFQFIRP